MGDTDKSSSISAKVTPTPVESTTQEAGRTSIECLHETKPAHNISINASIEEKPEQPEIPSKESTKQSSAKIETVFEKLDIGSDKSDSTTDSTFAEVDKITKPPVAESIYSAKSRDTKKSGYSIDDDESKKCENIRDGNNVLPSGGSSGRLNKRKDLQSTVFPVGCMGCKEDPPSDQASPRRFLDAKEAKQDQSGHIDSTPKKRPSSAQPNRNILTGAGIEDEVRRTSSRRKGTYFY